MKDLVFNVTFFVIAVDRISFSRRLAILRPTRYRSRSALEDKHEFMKRNRSSHQQRVITGKLFNINIRNFEATTSIGPSSSQSRCGIQLPLSSPS